MKKTGILCLLLVICILMSVPVQAAYQKERNPIQDGSHSLNAAVPLAGSEQYLETAKAVVAYELNTDTLLYTWNADEPINPTGMVKLLTALIVIEEGNLDDLVTVYRSTLDTISLGAVSAGLKAGEKVPLRDLLLCVMVASANDAAAVMAAHIAGTQKEFVVKMNERAAELGCTNSNFTNVHGLMDENQYSTARDLAIITEAALENPIFAEMFALKNFRMAATNLSDERYFITTNYMMSDEYMNQYYDYRITGGKPAAASSRDRSMICTAKVGNSHYLFVVMSVESQVSEDGLSVTSFGNFVETKKLMNFAFNGYTVRQLVDDDESLLQYAVKDGQNDVVLRADRDVFALLPADYDKNAIEYSHIVEASGLNAPIMTGDQLGVLQISYQGLILANCELMAMNPVQVSSSSIEMSQRLPQQTQQILDETDGRLIWILFAASAVAFVVIVVWLVIRRVKKNRDMGIIKVKTKRNKRRH